MIVAVAGAAFAYAFALWSLARVAARRKEVIVGPTPWLWLLASALATAACAAILPLPACALLCTGALGAVICGVVDGRTGYIFNELTLTMLGAGLLFAALIGSLPASVLAAAVIGGGMFALYAGTSGRGIGLGDVKLAAALSISLGLAAGAIAIGSAFIFGAAYGIALLLRRRAQRGDAIRFGPFIAAGAIVALVLQISGVRA